MKRLESKLHIEIEKICEIGDEFAKKKNFSSALKNYWMAYDLLPEPKEEWVAGTWILTAIADANFLNKDYNAGAANLRAAMYFPNSVNNPFLHLRLGQCYFELGEYERSLHEFMKVYNLEGEEIFHNEHEKYLDFLKSQLVFERLEMELG